MALLQYLPLGLVIFLLAYYTIPYFTENRALKSIPGPFTAKFSNLWLGLSARRGRKFAAVDWAHRKYGKMVRVGYNHVSIADERALQTVYAHGNGFLKEHV
jgi:benzoate 4-monooxygenase